MKPLPDPHCFDGIEGREYHREGTECYRTVERHRFLQYLHPVAASDDMLLGCPLFCRARSWSGDYHYRRNPPFLTVTLIHSGEMAFHTAVLSGIAEAGDLVLFPPRTEYEFLTPVRCERSAVLLEGPLLDALLPVLRQTVTLGDTSIPEHAMTTIGAALEESSLPAGRRKIAELCFSLLQFLAAPEPAETLPPCLAAVLAEMERRYDRPLSITELAKAHGITASGLTRMFLKYRNTTPYRYLRRLRMEQAAKLLDAHSFSIKEAAARAGYDNPLNFSTEFRKCFGISPRAYRDGGSSEPDRTGRSRPGGTRG